jgi:hypothetical protein
MGIKSQAKARAETCARLADQVADPVHRVALLALQGRWLALLDDAEQPGIDLVSDYEKLLDLQESIIIDAISNITRL